MIKLAYYFTRRKFGKVPSPIGIHSARLPPAFGMFYGKMGQLDKKLQLPRETVFLIREQVAHLNICLFCVDIGRLFATKSSMNVEKLDALDLYRDSPFFSAAERAALDYVTELQETRRSNRAPSQLCPASTPNAPSARSFGSWPANTSTTSPTSA